MTTYNEKVKYIKNKYPPGTKIILHKMGPDPRPVPPETVGEVIHVDDIGTIHCEFETGQCLGILPEEDSFSILGEEN